MARRNLVILGSTGSIGVNALDIVRRHKGAFRVAGLAANRNVPRLLDQIREFRPPVVAIGDSEAAEHVRKATARWPRAPKILNHGNGVEQLAGQPGSDFVLCGMVGASGLLPLIAALKAGKTVGLANKEALIVAGDLIARLARQHGATIVPVDSEHSAIYQCLQGHRQDVERIWLTASGGPFYRYQGDFGKISVEEALNHPTWKMGAKITVDSATLMNKGLEAIEAHFLFGVPMEKISIVIHPQSIVHSLVEFTDGAMLAQLSHPDMRLPIQYALTAPERRPTPLKRLHLADVKKLEFAEPDFSRFPCLALALRAGLRGGTAPVVLSSSNEEAVKAFIAGEIRFDSIAKVVAAVLKRHTVRNHPTLQDVLSIDAWARDAARERIASERK